MKKHYKYLFIILLVILYGLSSLVYYHSRKEKYLLFDPYLQVANQKINRAVSKKENTYRVLCLGGSTTLCSRIPGPLRYPYVLETILQKRYPLFKIEVFNAGQDWYTTKHSLISYVTHYQDWSPDLVIVMHGINDLYRSFSPERFAVGNYNNQWTHFYGPVINGAVQRPYPTFEKMLYERLFGNIVAKCRRGAIAAGVPLPAKEGKDVSLDRFFSIEMFEKYLRWIAQGVKSNNADIVLVAQPSLYKETMDPDEIRVLWIGDTLCHVKDGASSVGYADYKSLRRAMQAFNDVTKQVALSEGAIFVDAADNIPKNLQYFIDDCHYEKQGAELLARLIADRITESGLIRTKE